MRKRSILLALLLVLPMAPLPGCDAQGGQGVDNKRDGGLSCDAIKARVTEILTQCRGCQADGECVHPLTACGLPESCGLGYANKGWRTGEMDALLVAWAAGGCGDKSCACPAYVPPAPSCNAGTCGPRPAMVPVGTPCTGDQQCGALYCLTEAKDKSFVGGYCTLRNCDRIDARCPDGSDCRGGTGEGAQTVAICLARCRSDTGMPTCRQGYQCCSGPGPLRPDGWCSPELSSLCTAR